MPNSKLSIVAWIALIIGLVMLYFAYGSYNSTQQFLKVALRTAGTVVEMREVYDSEDGDYTYRPIINYTDRRGAERTYTSATSSNPPAYEVGDRVELLYNPQKLDEVYINSWGDLYIGALILGIIGGIDVLISGLILYFGYRRREKIKWLKENGKLVNAKVNEVSLNRQLKVNGRSPYIITAQWQDAATQTIHLFTSDNIWFDPTQYVKEEIEVWIDPNNPKSYYVKTDFLPKTV
jgi:hypothetical protein